MTFGLSDDALFPQLTCSLILRSSSMRYRVRAARSSVRGSTSTAGSTRPAGTEWEGGLIFILIQDKIRNV